MTPAVLEVEQGSWPTVAALREAISEPDAVIIIRERDPDSRHSAPASDVAGLDQAMTGVDAVTAIAPLTDAVHRVDETDRAVQILDRSALGYPCLPQAVRGRVLLTALHDRPDTAVINPAAAVLAAQGSVRAWPRP